ncbi:o-spanin [Achromobacter phage Mano]|uniref:O-spanin n=1 Tax=Achromobacter phage Mano TaxID=2767570 RepID=A0A7L8G6F7_9CAUD|nr:o-spanin [Achromobacter phage Mano]QOE32797.1 o-spanin [Achromobacter phage Mano]
MRSKPILCTAIAAFLLTGCASSMRPSQGSGPSPLVVASCPELAPIPASSDGTAPMGDGVAKLAEVAGLYRECRAAALAGHAP